MFKLVIQDDEGKTTVVPLIREELTIGRQEGNTIRLTERNVSRRHAKLLRTNGAITIEDLNSYNGIRVNGSRIQGRCEIKEADRVQIGDYLLEVKSEIAKADNPTQPLEMDNAPIPAPVTGSEAATVPTAIISPRHESDTAPAPVPGVEARPGEHGRLVVLSTMMAGREFELDKPAMVIGRTDENDIWINHRSISRHHAKIVRENGRYAIVDLQSANGVRVNGEEYGKVELRRGDVVDLGHVRMRFVEPGEDFVFGRDAQAIDLGMETPSRSGLWLVLALVVIGGAVGAFVLTRNGSDGQQQADTPVVPDKKDPPIVVEPTEVIDAAAADPTPDTPPEASEELRALLQQAVAARKQDDWAGMKAAATQALTLQPGHEEALELAEQADFELSNQATFEAFQDAVVQRKWTKVAQLYAGIDSSSVYKVKAQPDHDRLKSEYVKYQVQVAAKSASRGSCADLTRMARQTPPEWPEAAEGILAQKCQAPEPVVEEDPEEDEIKTDVNAGPSYEEAMEQAKAAAKDTQFGKALRLCRHALVKRPGDQEATMVCAIAACNLKNEAAAKKYVRRIKSASRKGMARQICLRNNITDIE